jgi:colanic acid biosynthesis glycosyl transferase WcaI
MAAVRRRLLALNQYYWPGVEADGILLTELCESLAGEWDVTVLTGAPAGTRPGRTIRRGVEIVRVPSTAFERRRLSLRALNYLTYFVLAGLRGLGSRRPDVVLCMTNPPFLGVAAYLVARRFRAPLVVSVQDVYPETALALGQLGNPAVAAALRALVGFYLRRADALVALGETMRRRLEEKGAPAGRLHVIPNWADTRAIEPLRHDNEWARKQSLADRFVVMHFGNVGHAQDLDSLIRAAVLLRDLDELAVAIVGTGARRSQLMALACDLDTECVRFVEHQPRDLAAQCLSTARVHVVGLAGGLAGFVVPSRVYGILAAARPVIAAADDDSETAQLVRTAGCGVVVPPGDPARLAEAIRGAYEGKYDLAAMGRSGRQYVVREASREKAVARYRELLARVSG